MMVFALCSKGQQQQHYSFSSTSSHGQLDVSQQPILKQQA
jgi:hypothetical protein